MENHDTCPYCSDDPCICSSTAGCEPYAKEQPLSGSERRLVLAFSAPHWPKPCTTKDLADIAKMTKREAANKLRALAKRGIVRQWHTDKSGQRRYGCVCWSLCQNKQLSNQ
jgi:hypothetical protein